MAASPPGPRRGGGAADTAPGGGGPAPLRGGRGLLAVLLTGQLMANMDSAIVNVAAPAVRADLHATGAELELVVGSYILAYALLLPAGARLGGLRGYRAAYLWGALLFTASSLACGLAPGALVLILVRTLQGAGAALMVPQVLTGIQLGFSGRGRVRALGLYAVTLSAGAVIGQVAGGLIVNADLLGWTWRPAFLVNVPIGAVLLLAGRRVLPDARPAGRRMSDWPGMAALAVAMMLFTAPLMFGPQEGWPPWTWLSLGLSPPAFAAFAAVERRRTAAGGRPFVNLEVLRAPVVAWGLAAVAVGHATYTAVLFTLPLHLQDGLGLGALWSGSVFAVWAAMFGVAGVYWRKIPPGARHLASPAGYGALALAYLGTAGAVASGLSDSPAMALLLGVGGLGLGLGFLPLVAAFTDGVAREHTADISGAISTVLQLSGVVGVAAFGSAYLALAGPPPGATGGAYTAVSAALAAAALLAAAAAALSMRGRSAPDRTERDETTAAATPKGYADR